MAALCKSALRIGTACRHKWHGSRGRRAQRGHSTLCSSASLCRRDLRQQLTQALVTVWEQLWCSQNCVNDPTKQVLARCSSPISLPELLHQRWLLPRLSVITTQGPKHMVQGVNQNVADASAAALSALNNATKVICTDLKAAKWPLVPRCRWTQQAQAKESGAFGRHLGWVCFQGWTTRFGSLSVKHWT
jgi:hypothetical protein